MNTNHFAEAERVFRQEALALEQTLQRLQGNFDAAVELILNCPGKVVVCGIGKAGIIGHKIAATLASTGTPAFFLNAGEALHGDLGVVQSQDVVLMVSNSAATPELARLVPGLRKIGARLVGIFGATETPLGASLDLVLDVSVEAEACPLNLAPMTSSTVALVTGDALAAALIRAKNFRREDFALRHPGGSLGRRLLCRVRDVMSVGRDLPVASPQDSLQAAIRELARGRLGAVVVCGEDRRVEGILTEGDVRRLYLSGEKPDQPVAHSMTRQPKVIGPDDSLEEALERMEAEGKQVYVLPVVDADGVLCGMLRMHDIVAG